MGDPPKRADRRKSMDSHLVAIEAAKLIVRASPAFDDERTQDERTMLCVLLDHLQAAKERWGGPQ